MQDNFKVINESEPIAFVTSDYTLHRLNTQTGVCLCGHSLAAPASYLTEDYVKESFERYLSGVATAQHTPCFICFPCE